MATFVIDDGTVSIENPHWRDASVSADIIHEASTDLGLECRSQELVQWGSPHRTDCFTMLRTPIAGATHQEARRVRDHPDMTAGMNHFRDLDALYRH
ncbi:MAG: hypothetical protein CMJ85_07130 [Planctomycetes bacterium]|nr:hypothetical protein [Planctomycetota bacterium]